MDQIRNPDWKDDILLKEDLADLVKRSYKKKEILVVMKKKYPYYAWGMRTLGNRLQHLGIKFIDNSIPIGDVYNAVRTELEGPGSKLGYRGMYQKVREVHGLNVNRDLVYDVMKDICPEGLESRGGVGISKKKKREKRFLSPVSSNTFVRM